MKGYQLEFSKMHENVYFDISNRTKKAEKMLRVIHDFLGEDLSQRSVLDVGCSTGVMCHILSNHFGQVTGIDIDQGAVEHAMKNYMTESVRFKVGDAMDSGLPAESFDAAICAHVYEHVPDPHRMMAEIRRVLKPGGICYFAAENKFVFREGDYRLPFLSILPKPIAHLYLRAMRRGNFYYETLFTYWQLKRLVADFELFDYTDKVVTSPTQFAATDLMPVGSLKQRIAKVVLKYAYWAFPTYIWVLQSKRTA